MAAFPNHDLINQVAFPAVVYTRLWDIVSPRTRQSVHRQANHIYTFTSTAKYTGECVI